MQQEFSSFLKKQQPYKPLTVFGESCHTAEDIVGKICLGYNILYVLYMVYSCSSNKSIQFGGGNGTKWLIQQNKT